jgi:Sulfotransferase domain
MTATHHTILNRQRDLPARRALISNFELSEGVKAPSQTVLKEQGWSLYCLHQETARAVFVKTPEDCDLSSTPFLRMAQYQAATNVLLVPWADLESLAEQVELPEKLILIFNIGRSGTTVVSHMLDKIPCVLSLSEPNVHLDITINRVANGKVRTQNLIAACTKLLCRPPYGPAPTAVVIKFYSQSFFNCAEYFASFPLAKYVYLYREGKSWANSMARMASSYGMPTEQNLEQRNSVWSVVTAASDPKLMEPFYDAAAEKFYPEQLFAAAWALQLEEYLKNLKAGVPFFALRYDEIIAEKVKSTLALLKHCDLPTTSLPEILQSFEQDSQEGSGIGKDNTIDGFKSENYTRFTDTLARHPRFNSPEIVLPDCYHPNRRI